MMTESSPALILLTILLFQLEKDCGERSDGNAFGPFGIIRLGLRAAALVESVLESFRPG